MRSAETPQSKSEFGTALAGFIGAWKSGSVPQFEHEASGEWLEFFHGWKDLTGPTRHVRAQEPFSFLTDRFVQFVPAFSQSRQTGMQFNFWKAAQLGRDEVRNCKVLAGFLDHWAEHGQRSSILCHLLTMIGLSEIAHRAAEQRYYTRTEVWPLGDSNSRIDIEIDAENFLILFEVKIGAPETGDQLRRYFELARSKAAGRIWSVIYLTPDGRAPADATLSTEPGFKPVSWLKVANSLCSFARDAEPSPIRDNLLQYAEFIIQNFV